MLKNINYSRRVGHKVPGVVAVLCVHGQVQGSDIPGMGHKVICVYFAGQIRSICLTIIIYCILWFKFSFGAK